MGPHPIRSTFVQGNNRVASLQDRIYPHLPISMQEAVCWAYGRREANIRYGGIFHRKLEELRGSEYWSRSDIQAYQDQKLAEIIRHAYAHVPYYRELMAGLKLTPADFRTVEDLQLLPVLTKEDVRRHSDRMVDTSASPRDLVRKNTSGTTGKSLTFALTPETIAFQWALAWRHRARFGIEWGALHANFTGKLAVPPDQAHPPYWRWCRPLFQAFIGMHQITPEKIGPIMEFLNAHDFEFYSGYPSILHVLAETAMGAGLELTRRPRIVAAAAENTFDYQRRAIQAFTGAVVTDLYGMSEACGNASQCPEMLYHEDFEFGILGCHAPTIRAEGTREGKIVCTTLVNTGFPLIRYEVGDVGVWMPEQFSCACGRASTPLSYIEGRTDDYVITPEGRRIMRFDYIFKGADNVRESQIVQEREGEITVRVVRRPHYDAADERHLRSEIARWISPSLAVRFDYVTDIERGPSGKFKAVRSLLARRPAPGGAAPEQV